MFWAGPNILAYFLTIGAVGGWAFIIVAVIKWVMAGP